jgi:nucleoside 2-deoxyribosyltransferase
MKTNIDMNWLLKLSDIEFNENKLYLAGPFFNEEQIKWMEWLESTCDKYNVPYFSPRLHGYNLDLENPTPENRKLVFRSDVEGAYGCGAVLASLDWLLPIGQFSDETPDFIQQCTWGDDEYGWIPIEDKDLNIPDTGTVFEVGMMYGMNLIYNMMMDCEGENTTAIIAYLTKPTKLVNLMITDSVDAILPSKLAIEDFIHDWGKFPHERNEIITKLTKLYTWEGECQ